MQETQLMPLVEAVQKATGYRPHLSTVLRWCLRPNRFGIVLESVVVGGRRLTSVAAVAAYNAANTAAASPHQSATQTRCSESSSHKAAMRALEAEGI